MQTRDWVFAARFWAAFLLGLCLVFAGILRFSPYTIWFIATAIWLVCGAHFHAGLFRALGRKRADANALVSLGASAAYFYSVASLFLPYRIGPAMWHELALLITFVNLGQWIEKRMNGDTGQIAAKLLRFSPGFARVISGGEERIVPIKDVSPGQMVLVKPGEQIPVDGTVTEGSSDVDESLLTGERVPLNKTSGDRLYGGTLNKTGVLEVKATGVGDKMVLNSIAAAVRDSHANRACVRSLADKISLYFMPVVLAASAVSAAAWLYIGFKTWFFFSLKAFVLIPAVACPCAISLAAPAAFFMGKKHAWKKGIHIRDATVVEKIKNLDAVILGSGIPEPAAVEAFDKMGIEVIDMSDGGKSAEEKALMVRKLQSSGKRVVMAGGGLNDALALSLADVSMAFNSGMKVATEYSDITLMQEGLPAVLDAIRFNRAIRRVIKQNFFWTFIFNILLIPLAAGALYPWLKISFPVYLVGIAMAASLVLVLVNSEMHFPYFRAGEE